MCSADDASSEAYKGRCYLDSRNKNAGRNFEYSNNNFEKGQSVWGYNPAHFPEICMAFKAATMNPVQASLLLNIRTMVTSHDADGKVSYSWITKWYTF